MKTPDPIEMLLAEVAADEVKTEETTPPSEAFLERARRAARRGNQVRRLRAGVARLGFQPAALPDYLARAAASAGVHLAEILAPATGEGSATAPWLRLAARLGMEAGRVKLHVRLWFAERQCVVPASGFARGGSRRETPSRPQVVAGTNPAKIADLLAVREETYDPATKMELAVCLREVDEIL